MILSLIVLVFNLITSLPLVFAGICRSSWSITNWFGFGLNWKMCEDTRVSAGAFGPKFTNRTVSGPLSYAGSDHSGVAQFTDSGHGGGAVRRRSCDWLTLRGCDRFVFRSFRDRFCCFNRSWLWLSC